MLLEMEVCRVTKIVKSKKLCVSIITNSNMISNNKLKNICDIYNNFFLSGLVIIPNEGCWIFFKRRPNLSEHYKYFARAQSKDVRDVYDYVKGYGHLFKGEIKPFLPFRTKSKEIKIKNLRSYYQLAEF